jgi:RNA polymerase sigma factor (sigma-70 family)
MIMFAQTMTHATLLERVSSGQDPSAWPEFCMRYEGLIRGFATRQGLQSADTDEILQDVLMALAQSMPGFQYDPNKGKFRSYLKTAVLHAIYRKSRQKRGEVCLDDMEAVVQRAAGDSSIEGHWEAEWRQYHLRLAMSRIEMEFNEKDRAAFAAYAVGGCDAGQVAQELSMSTDAVYQAKSRILRRLSELIELQIAEEG